MNRTFFFQTQQITDNTIFFNELKQQNVFFSYFQVDQNYYLFVYAQQSIDINLLYQSVEIIEELNSKQRKIRSLRGYFLYALEIIENGKDYEILQTNCQPFFWRKVKDTIRQNKKAALQEFLFGKDTDNKSDNKGLNPRIQILEDQIQTLQNQMDSLQQKIIQLESKLENPKYALRGTLHASDDTKTIQQGHYTLEGKKAPYLTENDPKRSAVLSEVRNPTSQTKDMESKSLLKHGASFDSEASKSPLTPFLESRQYNTSNQEKGLNEPNFISLGNLSEKEKIEIIKLGFQLNQERKIPLKKYYESREEYSLSQLKGYSIKYETIRRIKLYQNLKE